jgi:AraC-like DNA-binding protein
MSGDAGRASASGLLRARFGGAEGTVAAVFRHLATASLPKQRDDLLGLFQASFELSGEEGSGVWRFLSIREGVFAVLTDCTYAHARREHVVAEGLVEFHFLLEGPVELSLPQDKDVAAPTGVSLLACHQAPGIAYDVVCQPGVYRMLSLYVRPVVLERSFDLGANRGVARQLLHPADGAMAVVEQKIDFEAMRPLRDLFDIEFRNGRDLPLACARILELLALSASAIDRGGNADEDSIVFSARDLRMFDRAREVLATDFSESQTISKLARKLGTNATKLKNGFRLLYGATIFAYRNRHRMDRAMELLAAGETPIAAVAHAVGFRHQASFTSAFRAHFGLTPKQAAGSRRGSGA